jgi:adenylate cyclase
VSDAPLGPPPATGGSPGEDFERAVLGEEPVFTALDVAAETGATLEQAQRLWRALGFPEHGNAVAFTQGDVGALSTLIKLVDTGMLDFDLAVNLTRAVGQTMARLSDWEVSALIHRVEELEREQRSAGQDVAESRAEVAMRMRPSAPRSRPCWSTSGDATSPPRSPAPPPSAPARRTCTRPS